MSAVSRRPSEPGAARDGADVSGRWTAALVAGDERVRVEGATYAVDPDPAQTPLTRVACTCCRAGSADYLSPGIAFRWCGRHAHDTGHGEFRRTVSEAVIVRRVHPDE